MMDQLLSNCIIPIKDIFTLLLFSYTFVSVYVPFCIISSFYVVTTQSIPFYSPDIRIMIIVFTLRSVCVGGRVRSIMGVDLSLLS